MRLGNVARQFQEAQERHLRRPSQEEEVEMARKVVAMLGDKNKDQQLSEEFKRSSLDDARREIAAWIQSGAAKNHNASSADDCLASVDTMAGCNARIQEAMVLLATNKAEAAKVAEADAAAGT